MATNYIQVNRSKQPGNKLVRLAALLTEARQISNDIVNVGGHTITGANHVLMETVFGLTTGDGDDVSSMVVSINNILNKDTTISGVDRLADLDEFTGRLGLQ